MNYVLSGILESLFFRRSIVPSELPSFLVCANVKKKKTSSKYLDLYYYYLSLLVDR